MAESVTSLPSGTTVYRAIRASSWVQGGRISSAAFRLRSDKGEKRLSLLTATRCAPDFCEAGFGTCYGELSINVAAFNEHGFHVIPDSEPDKPNHASVIELPPYEGETLAEAERIAGRLAKQATIVRLTVFKRPKA